MSFSSPNGVGTTVSGFEPNRLYSINHSLLCGNTVVATDNKTVLTVVPPPCSPVVAPGGDDKLNVLGVVDFQEEKMHEVHYVQNENGMIKVKSPEDAVWGEQKLSEINVFPNPIEKNAMLTLNLPSSESRYQIDVLDVQGRIVKSFTTWDTRLEVSTKDYPSGIYSLRIQTEEMTSIKRVVIN